MAKKDKDQSTHDDVVRAAESFYEERYKTVYINPGGQKNFTSGDIYFDVIVVGKESEGKEFAKYVIEIETEDSVTESEAERQWVKYDKGYNGRWYLAVPPEMEERAKELVDKFKIQYCKVVVWRKKNDGGYDVSDFPK